MNSKNSEVSWALTFTRIRSRWRRLSPDGASRSFVTRFAMRRQPCVGWSSVWGKMVV